MDNFIVSARKYRPATFDTVVGQQHITNTLKNAIRNNQLAQAFLFCGPRGVGKTTCARILAKTINCSNLQPNGEACGECEACQSFARGNSFTVHELDAASNNSVEDIRSLIEQVRIPPQTGRYKIYIIDEVHMLSQAAFNAFLKTLEEPPSYAIFILATTEKHKILPTILSRCQIFDFNRIRVEDMAAHLASIAVRENIKYEDDGLHIIAQKADGGLRDALSMFDQIVNFSGGNVTYRSVIDNLNILDYDYYFNVTNNLLAEDTAKVLLLFDEILSKGFDGSHFISGLTEHLRNLLVGKDAETLKLLEVSEGIRKKYLEQAQASSVSFLLSAMNIANQCDLNYKLSKNQRLQVELALLKICHIKAALNLASLNYQPDDGQVKKKPESAGITQPAPDTGEPIETPVRPPVINTAAQAAIPPQKGAEPAAIPEKEQPAADKPIVAIPKLNTMGMLTIPSLKDMGKITEQAEDEDDPYEKGTDKEHFTYDDFLKYWHQYADKVKAEGKLNLLSIFTAAAPVMIKPYVFEVIASTKVLENLFKEDKPYILNFLRTSLKNFDIEINTRIEEVVMTKKLYSSTDKYQHMAAKNPQLAELRKRFNLDVE
ncbi:DNA polymerase III, subunit gamma and tau [Mucilaginibacter sp. PPCGB 2223]|uniref:DNA polymerase III subunit gamma/tau n=1 Tax=Mucilaginibacter sp. PPCGB 2223 TaxID=1886027 RepID=UPI000824DA89|nr:DNA polymerase III subunit gamma/tau [Mucilaginibacter sp. PPCGB 2223]OCX51841.1 DNA polymerase III, subunit gamma and tau [Mucilaginibacter sp. PPCGB 2223]